VAAELHELMIAQNIMRYSGGDLSWLLGVQAWGHLCPSVSVHAWTHRCQKVGGGLQDLTRGSDSEPADDPRPSSIGLPSQVKESIQACNKIKIVSSSKQVELKSKDISPHALAMNISDLF